MNSNRAPFLPLLFSILITGVVSAKNIAYIHGDIAADGTIPSGPAEPFDQMLLSDEGNTGLSQFKTLVEAQGYTISQHYDQTTNLDAAFLAPFDAVIFGLHQKVWSAAEQSALDEWIRAGGGILMYSDSAAGGFHAQVGINNPVGQTAVNTILSNYGMQVAVDQGGGTRAYVPDADSPNPIIWDGPAFEGEGVSPVAIDPDGNAQALIPLSPSNRISNGTLNINAQGITIANPIWAVIGLAPVERGNVIALFDRQPLWNNGPGSDINEEDNEEILRRIVRFLARDYGNSKEWFRFRLEAEPGFQVSYRQWIGGTGQTGFNYIARNNRFALEQQRDLLPANWRSESPLVEIVDNTPFGDNESEIVTVRILPEIGADRWFARLAVTPDIPPVVPMISAGGDRLITLSGRVWLEPLVSNISSLAWSKISGPGTVSFDNDSTAQTTATFSQPGTYELELAGTSPDGTTSDQLLVTVVADSDIVQAINAGGSSYSGENGINYSADTLFDGGGIDNFLGNSVAGTEDDPLYNTARSKGTFAGYTIPLNDGDYLVSLQFSETFFTNDNQRVFDLSLEGNLVLDNLDLHATAPGRSVAYDVTFPVTVVGGQLDLDVSSSINNPLLNALVVVEIPSS